jgi:hypothetical protein
MSTNEQPVTETTSSPSRELSNHQELAQAYKSIEEEVSGFGDHLKEMRKDYDFITKIRKEVANLIEPFRVSVLQSEGRISVIEREMRINERVRVEN